MQPIGRARAFRILTALCMASGLATAAAADERYRPVDDPQVQEECGACHMAFQPQMLPKRSWERIMDGLTDHFGEDASLSADTAQAIRAYLVANAADSGWFGGRFMRGLDTSAIPLRITETPHWIREHSGEVSPSRWNDPVVQSKANCPACHRRAARGDFDDD